MLCKESISQAAESQLQSLGGDAAGLLEGHTAALAGSTQGGSVSPEMAGLLAF